MQQRPTLRRPGSSRSTAGTVAPHLPVSALRSMLDGRGVDLVVTGTRKAVFGDT